MNKPHYKTIEALHDALGSINVDEVEMHIDGGEVIVVSPEGVLYRQDAIRTIKELFALFLSIEFAEN